MAVLWGALPPSAPILRNSFLDGRSVHGSDTLGKVGVLRATTAPTQRHPRPPRRSDILVESMCDLTQLSARDMVLCSAALRKCGAGGFCMEAAAQETVTYLYENLVHPDKRGPACLLLRLFTIQLYRDLDFESQQSARALLERDSVHPSTPCLTLLASAGLRSEWNDRRRAGSQRAIPIEEHQIARRFPLLSRVLDEIGIGMASGPPGSPGTQDARQQRTAVFLESTPEPSLSIRREADIPLSCPLRAVLGFGEPLPSGSAFVALLFSTVPIAQEQALRFSTIALSIKLAILPFDGRQIFASSANASARNPNEYKRHSR
jgi:hypothetical protein